MSTQAELPYRGLRREHDKWLRLLANVQASSNPHDQQMLVRQEFKDPIEVAKVKELILGFNNLAKRNRISFTHLLLAVTALAEMGKVEAGATSPGTLQLAIPIVHQHIGEMAHQIAEGFESDMQRFMTEV